MDLEKLLGFIELDRLPYALLMVLVAWLVLHGTTRFLDALAERFTGRRLMVKQLTAIGRFGVVLLTSILVLGSVIRFSNEALLAVGGSLAVAVGFAFKDLLSSLMAGLILLFDRPFQVGDRIAFEGHYGEVKEIGLRSVRLVTLDDNLVSIPNSQFLTGVVSSANAGALDQQCVFNFYVGCGEDFETARQLVYEAAISSRFVYLDKPVVVVVREGPVEGGGERFAVRLALKAYVFDGRYETAFGTDVTERVKRAFRQHGIRTVGELEELSRQPLRG